MKLGTVIYRGTTRRGTRIVMRYPKLSDAPAFCNFINILSKEQTFIIRQKRQITVTEERKWLTGILRKIKKNKAVMLSVFAGKELIGNAQIEQKSDAISLEGAFGIAVAKKFRGEGIGRLLMEFTIKESKRNLKGLRIITLSVFANNPIATGLYKKFGFKKYGSLPKGVFHRGKFIDHDYMYKRI